MAATCDAATRDPAGTLRYDLDLRLIPDAHRIEGTATLLLPAAEAFVTMRLSDNAKVRNVRVDNRSTGFTQQNGQLNLTDNFNRDFSEISVDYSATFNDPVPVDTVGVEDPSFGVSATILPEGVFLAEGVAWFPQIAGRKGYHRVRISAPAGMIAVTAGRFAGHSTVNGATRSEWTNEFPLEGLALSAGHYQVTQESLDDIQLLTFLSQDNGGLAAGYQAAMHRHLDFYRDLLGPYPFSKFAVVENFLPTGYGLPSWTLLGKSVIRLPFLLDTSLPHEIVHSWWGGSVDIDAAGGNWAEGVTTYLADYLLKERNDPGAALEYRRKILRDYAALVTDELDFPLKDFKGRSAKYQQAVGYGKGAMVFHMLRREIGDRPFWEGLRNMARDGHGSALNWGTIEKIFSSTSGRDLRWFFRQWVEDPGAPSLSFDNISVQRNGAGWKVAGSVRQAEPVYRINLKIQLTGVENRNLETALPLDGPFTRFAIDSPFEPQELEGDPGSHLFRRLDAAELPATVNDLLTPRRPLVIVAAGQEALTRAAKNLLKGLHWEDAEIFPEADAGRDNLSGRDLLLLGWPARKDLRPELPEGFSTNSRGCPQWIGSIPATPNDTLFAVLAGRQNRDGVRALFCSQTPEQARPVASKIAHYGRYSLLLFESGRNVGKMTWEPSESPMKVTFSKDNPP